MIIVLIGYMASGKSTIGKALAKKVDFEFIDLDDYIEEKEQKSIAEIFTYKGEIYFRKIESLCLKEIIESKSGIILSLGGGTPCYGNNMSYLQNATNTTSIYLKASIKSLVSRLENEKDQRPLIAHLNSQEELTEFIGKHLFERIQFYSLADKTIVTDKITQEELLEEIIFTLF